MLLVERRLKELYPEKYAGMHINEDTMRWEKNEPAKVEPEHKARTWPKKTSAQMVKQIRDRDGNKCEVCGSTEALQVHHKIYRSKGGADSPDNLITLCGECHIKAHEGEPIVNLMRSRLHTA